MKIINTFRVFFSAIVLAVFTSTTAHGQANVWEVLRQQFTLNHELNRPEVQHQLHFLIAHPSYLEQFSRSEPYIYHIVNQVKKRKLPGELAIIPMIESAFDPFAYSGAGAAGLWQLMPGTGTDLGLKQDWWFDARRSIGPSTDAALNYLTYLHKFFKGNWILAIAAYDSGQGTMGRIIRNSGQHQPHISFWDLQVAQETKAYIPRLLALAEIIQNPQRYHITLPDIPHTPYFEEVNIGSQIDLNHAAKLAGISYEDLIKLNPGYNHWTTAPYRPYKLLIPTKRVNAFNRNLAHVPAEDRISWARHKVSAGDSLTLIAQKYHTSVNLIRELNQLKSNHIKQGQFVLIPQKKPSRLKQKNALTRTLRPPKTYKVIHIVQKNDNFLNLNKTYGTTTSKIRRWNGIKLNQSLHPGQALTLWVQPRH